MAPGSGCETCAECHLIAVGSHPDVFVEDLAAPELDPADRHHLRRVLRVRDGDPLTVGDGRGGWRPARFGEIVEPTGEVVHVPRPAPAVTVAVALVKGERPELVVQKLLEKEVTAKAAVTESIRRTAP